MKKLFSICIPVYKNEKNLPVTIPYIINHLELFPEYDVEIIMVNDGSPDRSYEVMQDFQKKYPELIRIATLTRNFGQGACTHCCYQLAKGDVIGVMSADMQEPFELFKEMLSEWEKGFKLVVAAREGRKDKGINILFSKALHRFIQKYIEPRYPKGGFDFVVMDQTVVKEFLKIDRTDALGQLNLLWLGYDYKIIPYTRKVREIGVSGWNLSKRIDVAIKTLIHYTPVPIHFTAILGALFTGFSILAVIILGILSVLKIKIFSSVLFLSLLLFFGIGINLFAIGLIGEYVWSMFYLDKHLPRYVVGERREGKNE